MLERKYLRDIRLTSSEDGEFFGETEALYNSYGVATTWAPTSPVSC